MAAPTSFDRTNVALRDISYINNYPVVSGQQYNVGDLVLLVSGNVYPASQYSVIGAWSSGNEIQNWSGARSEFLGVNISHWDSTNVRSGSIRVAGAGIFQYPFPSASGTTYQPGTFVSFTQDQASGYFQSQEVMQCSGQATCIGKVQEFLTPYASGYGLLSVYLQSTVLCGTISNT